MNRARRVSLVRVLSDDAPANSQWVEPVKTFAQILAEENAAARAIVRSPTPAELQERANDRRAAALDVRARDVADRINRSTQ